MAPGTHVRKFPLHPGRGHDRRREDRRIQQVEAARRQEDHDR